MTDGVATWVRPSTRRYVTDTICNVGGNRYPEYSTSDKARSGAASLLRGRAFMSSSAFSADSWPTSIRVSPAERRDAQRKSLRVQARICPDAESELEAHTIDLSHHGVSITAAQPLNEGVQCSVELGTRGLAEPPALRAEVVYCVPLSNGQFRIGMRFVAVSVEAAELILAVLGV